MKKNYILFAAAVVSAGLLAFSCASTKERVVYTQSQLAQDELEDVLSLAADFDAKVLMHDEETLGDIQALSESLIARLDEAFTKVGLNSELQSKLTAVRGIVHLHAGNKNAATADYKQSLKYYKGGGYTIVLGSRLGLVKDIQEQSAKVTRTDKALLTLEQGLSAYSANDYPGAVAKLDEAFISLPDFYHEAYAKLRQNAWDFKDVNLESGIAPLLSKDSFSVKEMLEITQGSGKLLDPYTTSDNLTPAELFKAALEAGLLASRSSPDGEEGNNAEALLITEDMAMTRRLCARFLWNLYLDMTAGRAYRDYSTVYRAIPGTESPVPDLPLDSPDFDAVLGCVENEIISLDDGVNFLPEETPTPLEYSQWLEKVE